MSRHAWVSGASGFVGVNVVRELVSQGWQVTIFCRPTADLRDLQDIPVEVRHGDLISADDVLASMPENTDTVFHIAADTSVWSRHNDRQTRVNVAGTRHVLAAAAQRGVRRMVHTSSFATWGIQSGIINENTPPSTTHHWINYIKSKCLARDLVLEAVAGGLAAVIICPGHILGPYDRQNWARLFILLSQGALPGIPPGSGAFSDVRQIAKAQIAAADAGQPGEQFLLGGPSVSYLALLQQAAAHLQLPQPQRTTPAWLLKCAARVMQAGSVITGREPRITPEAAAMITNHMHCDSSKAEQALGYQQTPISELLQVTLEWLDQHSLLAKTLPGKR